MKPRSTKKGKRHQRQLNENPYVNGIVGTDGKEAIRALNDEEFEFLAKFNSEFVQGNFERDSDGNLTENNLHYNLVNGTEESVAALKAEIKALSEKLTETNGYREMNDRKAYWKYKKALYKEYSELKEKLESVDVVNNIYKDDYARRTDLMAYVGNNEITVLISDLFTNNGYNNNEESLFEYVESTKL